MTTRLRWLVALGSTCWAVGACRDGTGPGKSLGRLAAISAGSASTYHTCAVTTTGAAYCWGTTAYGQLGNGRVGGKSPFTEPIPVAVAGGLGFSAVGVGRDFTCGLSAGGAAYCWGDNAEGQLGTGTRGGSDSVPVRVATGLTFSSLNVGTSHTCALTADGAAYCWGGPWAPAATSVSVPGEPRLNQISVGQGTTCGITTVGGAYCWRWWSSLDSLPAAVPGAIRFTSISAGAAYACGLTADGLAYCWGANSWGQLGIGRFTPSEPEPTPVAGQLRFTSLDAGVFHTCAVSADGDAYCWGSDLFWELGDGDPTPGSWSVPRRVAGGHKFRSISVGQQYTCGVDVDGAGYCWGRNSVGQLGTGTAGDEYRPRRVVGF